MVKNRVLPKSDNLDALHTLAKAGISAIPLVGGPASELFSYVVLPPLTKRRDEWLQSIADNLKKLEENIKGFTIESLSKNDEFINMLLEVSHLAVRTHQKEKIESLRNAVLNTALEKPDEHAQSILIQFLSVATHCHIKVLKFYKKPEEHLEKAGVKLSFGEYLSHHVVDVVGELKKDDALRCQIERDLLHYGLIFPEGEWYSSRTTNSGDKILKLITSPLKNA